MGNLTIRSLWPKNFTNESDFVKEQSFTVYRILDLGIEKRKPVTNHFYNEEDGGPRKPSQGDNENFSPPEIDYGRVPAGRSATDNADIILKGKAT